MYVGNFPRSLPPPERTLPRGGARRAPSLCHSCWSVILGCFTSPHLLPVLKADEFVASLSAPLSQAGKELQRTYCPEPGAAGGGSHLVPRAGQEKGDCPLLGVCVSSRHLSALPASISKRLITVC